MHLWRCISSLYLRLRDQSETRVVSTRFFMCPLRSYRQNAVLAGNSVKNVWFL